MKRACVFLAEGFEEIEALAVVDLLRRAGIETVTVSIAAAPEVTGRSAIQVKADTMWTEEVTKGADLLFLPGGQPGTTWLGRHEGLRKQLAEALEAGCRVSAICAAPTVLAAQGLLKGKRAVCYPGLEQSLTDGGASVPSGCAVVTDGLITTSRGAGTAIPFALELISLLLDEKTAREIGKSIVYG